MLGPYFSLLYTFRWWFPSVQHYFWIVLWLLCIMPSNRNEVNKELANSSEIETF